MTKKNTNNKTNIITILGDSTIDNRVWVSLGLIGNAIVDNLHLTTLLNVLNKLSGHPKSVIENLKSKLPNDIINDYTNDGFTTTDCLKGNNRDKVFGDGALFIPLFPTMFPHKHFNPIREAKEDIKKSDHIILSIGGNNFRQFLVKTFLNTKFRNPNVIKNNYQKMLAKLQIEYVLIFNRIRELNKDAHIILMTQYYPSMLQTMALKNMDVYSLMKELGKILNIGGEDHDPMTVIHEIMKQTYSYVLNNISTDNVSVVDVTSSLNPYDDKNHVSQIEPSIEGGKKIAEMLKYAIESKEKSGKVYSFQPAFFDHSNNAVNVTAIATWQPKKPGDFIQEGNEVDSLLCKIADLRHNYSSQSDIYHTALQVHNEAKKLSKTIKNSKDLENITKPLAEVVTILKNPSNKVAINQLKTYSSQLPHLKTTLWEKFNAALYKFVGSTLNYIGENNASKTLLPTSFCKQVVTKGRSIYNQGVTIFNGKPTVFANNIYKLSDDAVLLNSSRSSMKNFSRSTLIQTPPTDYSRRCEPAHQAKQSRN